MPGRRSEEVGPPYACTWIGTLCLLCGVPLKEEISQGGTEKGFCWGDHPEES